MTKKDWTDDLARKLARNERKAPEGLLDNVREEMKRRGMAAPMVVVKPRRRWAVAATIAVLVAGSLSLWLMRTEEKPQGNVVSSIRATKAEKESVDETAKEEPLLLASSSATAAKNVYEDVAPDELSTNVLPEEASAEEPSEKKEERKVTEHNETTAPSQPAEQPGRREEYKPYEQTATRSEKPRRRVRVSLLMGGLTSYAAGGAGGAAGEFSMADPTYTYYDPFNNLYSKVNGNYTADQEEQNRRVKHHKPLRTGISLTFPLGKRWNLITGVSYSYLRSEFRSGAETAETVTKQKLHYVGIPVGVSYTVWRKGCFGVYARGGAEVQKLVSGKAVTTTPLGTKTKECVKEGRPQFSMNLAAGAEYATPIGLSLYVEPGLNYYIDNGSSVENVYKDKKFSPGISFGLRLNFKK